MRGTDIHQSAYDPFCMKQVTGMCDIHILPVTIERRTTVGNCKDIGVFPDKPGWDSIGRRTNDHVKRVSFCIVQDLLYDRKVKNTV